MSAEGELNLVWLDLEMTGLDPDRHVILEIATAVTDPDLNVLAEGPNLALRRTGREMARIDDWSARTHQKSGLLERVRSSSCPPDEAERLTIEFLGKWVPRGASPLCGNSVHQDRRFLRREMPQLDAFFHYRNVDVSTIKELARRWYPDLEETAKPDAHMAREDVIASIEELRRYRSRFFAPPAAQMAF